MSHQNLKRNLNYSFCLFMEVWRSVSKRNHRLHPGCYPEYSVVHILKPSPKQRLAFTMMAKRYWLFLCLFSLANMDHTWGYQVERKGPQTISGDETLQVIDFAMSRKFYHVTFVVTKVLQCHICIHTIFTMSHLLSQKVLQCHTCNSDEDPSGCSEADPGPLVG